VGNHALAVGDLDAAVGAFVAAGFLALSRSSSHD
jgi:hypothetical protein